MQHISKQSKSVHLTWHLNPSRLGNTASCCCHESHKIVQSQPSTAQPELLDHLHDVRPHVAVFTFMSEYKCSESLFERRGQQLWFVTSQAGRCDGQGDVMHPAWKNIYMFYIQTLCHLDITVGIMCSCNPCNYRLSRAADGQSVLHHVDLNTRWLMRLNNQHFPRWYIYRFHHFLHKFTGAGS